MGLTNLLLGPTNPLSMFVGANKNTIRGIGAGLASGPTFQEGLSKGAQYAAQGGPLDDQEAIRQQQINETAEQKNKTIQAMLEAGREDLANMAEAGQMAQAWQLFAQAQQPTNGPDAPSSVREHEYFLSLDEAGKAEYLRMKRANPYLDLGDSFAQPNPVAPGTISGPAIPKNGNVPTGYEQAQGGGIQPMPGSEPDIDRRNEALKAQQAITVADAKTANVLDAIETAESQVGWGETGMIGAIAGNVAGSRAYDLRSTITTIKANLGFSELQAMRDASPTGGALGQVAVQELVALQSTIANLDPNQSEERLKAGLKKVKEHLVNLRNIRQQAYADKYGGGAAPQAVGGGAGDGWTVIGVE